MTMYATLEEAIDAAGKNFWLTIQASNKMKRMCSSSTFRNMYCRMGTSCGRSNFSPMKVKMANVCRC